MSNLPPNDSIAALAARPPEALKPREISTLQSKLLAGGVAAAEFDVYNRASVLALTDAPAAFQLLVDMEYNFEEIAFQPVRIQLMSLLTRQIKDYDDSLAAGTVHVFDTVQNRPGGLNDQAREAAFRATPGRFLPGAIPSTIRLLKDDGFGLVSYEGQTWAWTYAAVGMARSDLSDLATFVDDMRLMRLAGGILVGPPEAHLEVVLPEGWLFVAVELGNTGGRAA